MAHDASVAAEREKRYRRFWRRRLAGAYRSSGPEIPHVDVYAFRPTRKPWAPARWYFVYITGGLSDVAMPAPQLSRVELSCYATGVPGFGSPREDAVAKWLHALPQILVAENLPLIPGGTLDLGSPLAPDSEMSGFYLGIPPEVDAAALCRATVTADSVLHLIPISEAERILAERDGSAALGEAFRKNDVLPVFDLERRSCV